VIGKINTTLPPSYEKILKETISSGFSMASDILTCSLLRTMAASKPEATLLELGTGTGLSTCWILDGMDQRSKLTSIDNAKEYIDIAGKYLGADPRLDLIHADASEWITNRGQKRFDYIFADTWHGKFLLLEQTLDMLNKGALYIIDDLLPQPNWPEGHDQKVSRLIEVMESRKDLLLTKLLWSTGLILAVKK
jgi:predicted O-methyltransferase YrrM